LTDAAGLAPSTGYAAAADLLPLAYSFAREVYPDLLRPGINRFPAWLPWIFPQPLYSRARPQLADYLVAGRPFYAVAFAAALAYALYLLLTEEARVGLFFLLGIFLIAATLLFLLSQFWGGHQEMRWRKRMAAILSIQYGLAAGWL